MSGVDIILVEGYKSAGLPSIEVLRRERSLEPMGDPDVCIAVAADAKIDANLPQFDLDDAEGLAALLVERFLSS